MVKTERLEKSIYAFVIFLIIATVAFSTLSYISIKTNVNIIRGAISTITGMFSGMVVENLTKILSGLSAIYKIAILELIVLCSGVIASLLAIGYIANIYFEMRKKTFIDELTGVYNKRALYKILDMEIKRAERFKHPLTIIMLDIDFFKVYNDKNGHLAGDLLLKKMAKLIENKVRDIDSVARFGGEEFVIILPETSHEGAVKVGEKIRKAIADAHFQGEEKQPSGNITVSMGLVTFHGEYKTGKHLLVSADELLYRAKELGRNRLINAYYAK